MRPKTKSENTETYTAQVRGYRKSIIILMKPIKKGPIYMYM